MGNRLVQDNQPGIDKQSPSLVFLTKDKFGGTDFETVQVQTNRVSKRFLASVWLENFILSPGILEIVPKFGAWFTLGCILSIVGHSSLVGAVLALPVLACIIWITIETLESPLQWSVWLLCSLLVLGFMVSM